MPEKPPFEPPQPPVQVAEMARMYPATHAHMLKRSDYVSNVYAIQNLLEIGDPGWNCEPKDVKLAYQVIGSNLESWVVDYALADLGKDWETLRARFPRMVRKYCAETLAGAFLYKTILTKIFQQSFWYLDGHSNEDQRDDQGFAPKLQYLYERFFQTNPKAAVVWKRATHRLAKATRPGQARDLDFGKYNQQRQEDAIQTWADELLASETFGLLLISRLTRKDLAQRRDDLLLIFQKAVAAMERCEAFLGGHIELRSLSKLNETYQPGTENMVHHFCHGTTSQGSTLEGRRILLVTQPTVIYHHHNVAPGPNHQSTATIISKASVVLEKKDQDAGSSEDDHDMDISGLAGAEIRRRKNTDRDDFAPLPDNEWAGVNLL
ncbi:uncharacterized protein BO80DRAFT_483711 [Aspergillus ibericus CBS 121593]|uniref:Uncharacterized protein n=1 Tax=Aspergillus ibericus CBS 121593 TaxID=1448316 RepID=A0A395GPL3_9EURO|nr:hypothetical protein BO80DRAFT_483711 [Aspergillus ibericus CBS 121593]RAK96787.1 hypothetical protein BO80DRAFT_483711 [Aspergillus ibericus CBS 121593]